MAQSYSSTSVPYLTAQPHVSPPPFGHVAKPYVLALVGYLLLGFLIFGLAATSLVGLSSMLTRHLLGSMLILSLYPLFFLLRAIHDSGAQTKGVILHRPDAEELFRLIDRVCSRLQAPAVRTVRVTSDCNASALQSWRSPSRGNQLIIGLTLFRALTVEQFEALIAHEVSHLTRMQALTASLILRLCLILKRLEATTTRFKKALSAFHISLCGPYAKALTSAFVPLNRYRELSADRASVELTSARIAAQALTSVAFLKTYLVETYWPEIWRGANDVAQPVATPFSDFTADRITVSDKDFERWQRAALAIPTAPTDTHPCFCERLAAIGGVAEFAPPSTSNAADILLSGVAARIASLLDATWRLQSVPVWQKAYQSAQQQRQRLKGLRSAALDSALDESNSLLHATLEENVGDGAQAALAMRIALRERFPSSLPVQFALGRQLLLIGNSEGVTLIEQVLPKDPRALVPGTDLLRRYYHRQGEMASATLWHRRYTSAIAAPKGQQGPDNSPNSGCASLSR